jgi:hypothetical protein
MLTVAVADCPLTVASFVDKFHEYTDAYPGRDRPCSMTDCRRWHIDSWRSMD